MSRNKIKFFDYFEQKPSKWDIIEFLEVCDLEPFEKKVNQYIRCLDIIVSSEQGNRKEKAEALLKKYRDGTKTDQKRVKDFEKKHKSSKLSGGSSIHIYNSTLSGNSLSGNSLGIGTVAGTVSVESGSERHKLEGDHPSSGIMLRKRNRVNYAENSSESEIDSDYGEKSERAKRKSTGSLNDSSNHFPESTNDSSDNKNDESESESIVFELDELKKRIESQSRNEWIVNTINVSIKFKEYQMQLIENVINGVKITWKDKFEILALSSIIVLIRPCPYSTFTTYEWDQVVNTNPYAVKESILTNPLSSSLYEACSHVAMGLDYNFISNDESDLGKKASRIFNNLKEELPLAPQSKITEDEHRFNYLDPFFKPFFCGGLKNYEVRLNKSVKGSLKRPDYSCRVDKITILNSEVKPSGCTSLQENKDFVKANLRSKRSINQLLHKKGGPNQSMFFLNMGNNVHSYFVDLQYDGIYRSWPWLSTKLVTEKASFPLMVLTTYHFAKMEQQVQRIANDYESRKSGFYTPPEQIRYIIEEPDSAKLKNLLGSNLMIYKDS